jgi:hypothetical protein
VRAEIVEERFPDWRDVEPLEIADRERERVIDPDDGGLVLREQLDQPLH